MGEQTTRGAASGWKPAGWVFLFTLAVWAACFRFPQVWSWTGIGEGDKPFLDLYGLLASGEGARAGFDPSMPNPLDPYYRPNVYPEWWLVTGSLGLDRSDNAWLGAVLIVAVLAMAVGLLRPRNAREAVSAAAVLGSPAILLGVNRANNDLVIFLLGSAALLVFRRGAVGFQLLASLLLAVCAALKYFPVAGILAVLHGRDWRTRLASLVVFGGVLLAALPAFLRGVGGANPFHLHPEWLYAFGAAVLWRNFHWDNALLWMIPAALLLVWAARSAWSGRGALPVRSSSTAEEREFLVGSAMIVACFFAGASYAYKLVFALWMLPWLWRGGGPQPFARFTTSTIWLLYAVLWFEGLGALTVNLAVASAFPRAAAGVLYTVLTGQQLLTWMLVAWLLRWIFADVLARALPLKRPAPAPAAMVA